MHLLFHIVYRAHAKGTHHKLALDALRHLKGTDFDYWQRVFLAHAKLYLEGAEAPDDDFRDFENHVLHTRDGLWGGAPTKVQSWYHHVVEALAAEDWPTAVYCAGVLSHYYADPLQPFHTAQSEAENNIHRAVEWSIARSYGTLYALGLREFADMRVEVGAEPNWLVELTCRGAEKANHHYEKLMAHYDIGRGVVDPPAGLDRVARRIVAEMIRYAYLSYAVVLDRAITESHVFAPEIRLGPAALLAAVEAPTRALARKAADARERRLIEAIYDELQVNGTVERHLPEEQRVVRDRFAREVLAKRAPSPPAAELFPFRPRERVVTRVDRQREARKQEALAASAEVIPLRPAGPLTPAATTVPVAAAAAYASTVTREPMLFVVPSAQRPGLGKAQAGPATTIVPAASAMQLTLADTAQDAPRAPANANGAAGGRAHDDTHLTLDDAVSAALAAGARTLKRLETLGVTTVRDLLKADPESLAVQLNSRSLTADTIGDWQDQALLMCAIPGLRPAHGQLLVGAGYRSAQAIADAEADKLCADVLAFAATSAGQRALRSGDVPDMERIKGWLEAARRMRAA
ncbi:MAG: DUF4332 domain-containing protein [Hyphomicrobiaceae bacterium]|nr:DUF4332 domain-containing protein [Hyphomicrobiaceae bacterium]